MSREQRIEIVLRAAEERGQDASRALAHRRQILDESVSRLQELISYRDEYADGGGACDAGLAVHLQDYWRFMSRLNSAITEHRERTDQHRAAVEQSFERWQKAQRRVAVLEKVIDRVQAADRRVRERVEQRTLDDLPRRSSDGILRSDEA